MLLISRGKVTVKLQFRDMMQRTHAKSDCVQYKRKVEGVLVLPLQVKDRGKGMKTKITKILMPFCAFSTALQIRLQALI